MVEFFLGDSAMYISLIGSAAQEEITVIDAEGSLHERNETHSYY